MWIGCDVDVETRTRQHGISKHVGDQAPPMYILTDDSDKQEAILIAIKRSESNKAQ